MTTKKSTIIRAIALAIVIINMLLKACGVNVINIDESEIAEFIEMLISIAVIILSWWKNNSFTENAKLADMYLESLKEFDREDDENE